MANNFFVYGIFTNKYTRQSVFNRKVDVRPARLNGYRLGKHRLGHFKCIYESKNDHVNGFIMELKDHEIPIIDNIEGVSFGLYKRKTVKIEDQECEVYYND